MNLSTKPEKKRVYDNNLDLIRRYRAGDEVAGEEIVRFEPTDARFIRLKVLSTTGSHLGRGKLATLPARLSGITLFK